MIIRMQKLNNPSYRMLFVCIFFLVSPFLGSALLILLLPIVYCKCNLESRLYMSLLVFFVVIVNATKMPESDLMQYYIYFSDIKDMSLLQAISSFNSDWFFWGVTWVSTFFHYPKAMLIIVNALTIYLLLVASKKTLAYLDVTNAHVRYVQYISVIFYFSQPEHISHTMRAFLAISFFVCGYTFTFKNAKIRAFFMYSLGSLTHLFSTIFFFQNITLKYVLFCLLTSFLIGAYLSEDNFSTIINVIFFGFLSDSGSYLIYRAGDDTQATISVFQLVVFIVELSVAYFLYVYGGRKFRKVIGPFFYLGCFILIFRNIPLFSIRFYICHNYYFSLVFSCFLVFLFDRFRVGGGVGKVFALFLSGFVFITYIYKFNFNTNWVFKLFLDENILHNLLYLLGV